MRMKSYPEATSIVGTARSFQSQGHAFGVAVLAACADFCTAGDWIPGGFSAFDLRILSRVASTENISSIKHNGRE